MPKVILIEDRSERKSKLLKRKEINLSPFKSILFSCEKENFKKLKEKIKDKILSVLDEYHVIISHRSAWPQKELDLIKKYCAEQDKILVLFSGGITNSFYSKVPCKLLTMDVEDLYCKNLKLFLAHLQKTEDIELPLLQYGKKWKLDILLKARNKIAVFLEKERGIERISPHVIQDVEAKNLGLTSTFHEIQKEMGCDMEWYKKGIKKNAYSKLAQIKQEIDDSIKKELFRL